MMEILGTLFVIAIAYQFGQYMGFRECEKIIGKVRDDYNV